MIQKISLSEIDFTDPIFTSLKQDYPTFEQWVSKIKKDEKNRVVFGDLSEVGMLKNIAIVKIKDTNGYPKISTFKVSPIYINNGLGNQLLEQIIFYLKSLSSSKVFIDVFPKHEILTSFIVKRGFSFIETTSSGENRFVKDLF